MFLTILLSTFIAASVVLADEPLFASAQTVSEGAGPRDDHQVDTLHSADGRCSRLIVLGFQGSYPLQDFGFEASGNKPVNQDMFLVSCGHFSVDVWTSVELSDDGKYAERGPGDEWDLELTYDNSVETPVGKVNYEIYAAYFALDLGKGLNDISDDYFEVYGEVSKELQVGRVGIAPFARYIHLFGIDEIDLDFVRTGIRLDVPFTLPLVGELRGHGELAHAANLNGGGAVEHRHVWRGELDLTKELGAGWCVTVGVKLTEFARVTPIVKLAYSF
ncbi:hypothetical protein A2678_01235 [Candidatus Kaiserbacteria bacterium RIFCSPHIGHO2_01_FULL_53_31]|uniref:Uncharacterized protein n=1 Tax=Candidatus Kaiserbacteria bacterium RIFCSPHIGHO2_01_FULL_53_31 TaxID=1798481 RepID=A0A1F6CJD7_9BACT|nr:MAG: hypothetical protein A2678_01235 [Candidatus Kaiserbacteria bacterium RIFCSPHIGHO2_01_FULL_53_31]